MDHSKTTPQWRLQPCALNLLRTSSKTTNSSLDQRLKLKMAQYIVSLFNICIIHISVADGEGQAILQLTCPSDLFINLETYCCQQGTSKLTSNWLSYCSSHSCVCLCELLITHPFVT